MNHRRFFAASAASSVLALSPSLPRARAGEPAAAAGADDLESLARLRGDFELGLGVVDVTPGAMEPAQTIVARIDRALTRIDAKRITLNPDCGFAPGSAASPPEPCTSCQVTPC